MKTRDLSTIDMIILHCSANGPTSNIGAAEIRRYHMLSKAKGGRGWDDIGYHFVIRRDGTVETGRDLKYQGAHCTGYNAKSIGICLVGGINGSGAPEDNFTEAQFNSLAGLIIDLRERWPYADIYGHNEFANKACPVFSVPDFLHRYNLEKCPGIDWDNTRWPHFQPSEFSALWIGARPQIWEDTLDGLERLREDYGHPLVILKSLWERGVLQVDIRVPAADRDRFIALANEQGFSCSTVQSNAVRCWR